MGHLEFAKVCTFSSLRAHGTPMFYLVCPECTVLFLFNKKDKNTIEDGGEMAMDT